MLGVHTLNTRCLHTVAGEDLARLRNLSLQGNTALILLDAQNILGSKRSFDRAVRKAQAWLKANGTYVDLSKFFGPGTGVYTTAATGTFHITYVYRQRKQRSAKITEKRLTVFLYGRDLYIRGWRSDKGLFEIQGKTQNYNYIKDPNCKRWKVGMNYSNYCDRGPIEDVRIGLFGMMDHFDSLEKCDGIVSSAALKAIAGFAINSSEPIRLAEVKAEILESYENYELVYLGSRGSRLASQIRCYRYYSTEYLRCVSALVNGHPMPEIDGDVLEITSLKELMSLISVPLRGSHTSNIFNHEKYPDPDFWCPPCQQSRNEDEYWLEEDKKIEEEEGEGDQKKGR
jgi:hypothetical protein